MSGHTPGPWRVSLPDETLILGPDRQIVATTLQDEEDYAANYDRRAADAVLIAAAPTLLAELREATRLMVNQQADEYGPRENWPARVQIERQEAAIAAAEPAP